MTLTLMGDPAQSIYQFQDSDPHILLNFEKMFSKVKGHTILKNYRTPKQLVLLANEFRRGFEAFGIEHTPSIPNLPEMDNVLAILNFPDSIQEINYISREIRRLHDSGVHYSKINVLCRSNKLLTDLESGFITFKIPYFLKYDSWSVMRQSPFRFLYCLYSITINPKDILAFSEVFVLLKGIGDKFLSSLKSGYSLKEPVIDYILNSPQKTKQWEIIKRFTREVIQPFMKSYETGVPFISLNRNLLFNLDEVINYDESPKRDDSKLDFGLDRGQFLKVFITVSNVFNISMEDPKFTVLSPKEQFLEIYESIQLSQDTYGAEKNGEDVSEEKNAVGLYTIHSYKGRENDHIYLAQSNPLSGIRQDDLENRSVFYVAITRSKRRLVITSSDMVLNYENRMQRSVLNPFLLELIQIVKSGTARRSQDV